MNVATAATGFTLSILIVASVALFAVEQPVAGWVALVVGLFGTMLMLGMIASTGRAAKQQDAPLPPPAR